MRLLGQGVLQKAARKHPNAANALTVWRAAIIAAAWAHFPELKAAFPSADYVAPFTIFNIKGNNYRLIALVDYAEQIVVARDVLTHAAYDKGKWR